MIKVNRMSGSLMRQKKTLCALAILAMFTSNGWFNKTLAAQQDDLDDGRIALAQSKDIIVEYSPTKYPAQQSEVFQHFATEIEKLNLDTERTAKFGKITPKDVTVYLYDLNGDGVKEIFAMINAYPDFCWGTGCNLYVFAENKNSHELKQILATSGQGQLQVAPEIKNGYSVIHYSDGPPTGRTSSWVWNGTAYSLEEGKK